MNLSKSFPKYEEFDPQVPVWCVTPDVGGCIHRFFDTSPISPSGRYLAVFQLPQEERLPEPGEKGQVRVIDLETGENRVVAQTCGWEPQLGANLNWGRSDKELYFNDVDTATWRPFAWKLNPHTLERQPMDGTVYHASPDGRWLVSANMASMRRTQPGYGVVVPDEIVPRTIGLSDIEGFYLTDTTTGKRRLLASTRELITQADPAVNLTDPGQWEIYGFHSKFNGQGDRLMLSLRWFPAKAEPQLDVFRTAMATVRYAWVTLRLDGSEKHCVVGPEQWEKGGHHATWFPDGKHISMNLNIDCDGLKFVQVGENGTGLRKMLEQAAGSGHPTVSPDGRYILTDTYTNEPQAYGDGTVPLRWIDLQTGAERALVRINTAQPAPVRPLRVDPHPAWDRSGRYVTFNGFVGGTRRVFMADLLNVNTG